MIDRKALRHLLVSKRRKIDPTEFGWPKRTGPGRRSPGISQAQLAQALYVSERTYAALERGDAESVKAEFLDSVARVLRMKPPERTALYVYAVGYEPPTPMDPEAGMGIPDVWHQAVNRVTGQPCYVNDVAWNILVANGDFFTMFPREVGTPPVSPPRLPEQNLIRWMLLREEAREHMMVNWEKQWAGPVAGQLRTAVAAHPDNKDLQQLDKDVNEDPVAGPIYRNPNLTYVHPDGDTRLMRHAGYRGTPGSTDFRDQCCDQHAPSQLGYVTMCSAQPHGSPGTRVLFLVFEPIR
ncbi:helix-turn-helix domain-containing protein [Streptomyces sp. NPDC047525]|uniref:MmyB family transcriptional regulator n=1 Tax=Streptomyces sp. NPDC047525 TaxID=3155264 RepID=UPI0034056E08